MDNTNISRDKSRFLEIVASNLSIISEVENIIKILVLTFFSTSIFIPLLNILGMPLWLSMEKGMFEVYMNTNSKDEYGKALKEIPISDLLKVYFPLFLGFGIGQAILYMLFLIPIFLIYAKLVSIGLFIFIALGLLYVILTVRAIHYLFNFNCEGHTVKDCILKGFKSNFNFSYTIEHWTPFRTLKILFVVFLILLIPIYLISLLGLLYGVIMFYISLIGKVEILRLALAVLLAVSHIIVIAMIITFFIHITLYYIATRPTSK